jgi:predicted small metal-binding protein
LLGKIIKTERIYMEAKVISCPEAGCSHQSSGASEEEVLAVAVDHAVNEHGQQDTPELRARLKALITDQSPAV